MQKLTVKVAKCFLVLLIPSMFLFSCEDDSIDLGGTPDKKDLKVPPR